MIVRALYRRFNEPPLNWSEAVYCGAVQQISHMTPLICSTDFSAIMEMYLHCAFVNQYLTIIMDVHSYQAVSKHKQFDFDAIQKQVSRDDLII